MKIRAFAFMLLLGACASPKPVVIEDDSLTEGMISSSTYQVNVTAFGANEAEARAAGEKEARRIPFRVRGAHVALALPGACAGGLRGGAPRLQRAFRSPAFPSFLPSFLSG